MSTTAQKLEYLGTTKSQLKDMINYGLDDDNKITSSTTFRNYVSSIFNAFLEALRTPDTLFTNLPKKSGTGANITLNDTANAPMRIELGASELSQSATPTPSSPQDIHTISGSNKVVVSNSDNTISQEADIDLGYENLANITSFSAGNRTEVYNNTCYFKNGTYSTASSVALYLNNQTDLILKANQTYTISVICNGKVTASTYKVIYLKIGDQSTINMGSLGSNTRINYQYTPTADEPIKFISFDMGTNQTFEDYSVNIQVEKGSVAHPYTEYGKAIEYCKIGNYEDKFIRTSGKNLIDSAETHYGINGNTGAITTENAYLGINDYVSCKPNTTYTISFQHAVSSATLYVGYKTQSGTYIERVSLGTTRTFTTPNNAYYMFAYIYYASGFSTIGGYVMLNEGSTALDYEPYGSNEWYIKKNIGKVVLDGTEDGWNKNTEAISTNAYINNNLFPNRLSRGDTLCNYLNNVSSAIGTGIFSGGGLNFCFESSDFDTVEKFTTWLSTHNTIVYYQLNTPTYTQITGTLETQLENVYQKLLSYSGTTNISQVNNDLAFNMSVSAIEEL